MADDATAPTNAVPTAAQPMAAAALGGVPPGAPYAGMTAPAMLQQQAHAAAHVQTRQVHLAQQHSMAELNAKLQTFWGEQLDEVQHATDFKNHLLPLARIKKIMKSDEDVRMISAEAPVLFAKACEMFILELTHRAWAQTEEAKRRTLQRSDISTAIQKTDIFDFLIDIVPRDDPKKEDMRAMTGAVDPSQQVQYYMQNAGAYMPAQTAAAATGADSGVMFQPGQQQVYGSAGYAAGMYPQGVVNAQYMRPVMYTAPQNYNQTYLAGNTTEQQQPQS